MYYVKKGYEDGRFFSVYHINTKVQFRTTHSLLSYTYGLRSDNCFVMLNTHGKYIASYGSTLSHAKLVSKFLEE